MWTVYEMASFGRGLGRVECAYCCVFWSISLFFRLCLQLIKLFHDHRQKEIDHSAKDNLSFLLSTMTLLKSIAGRTTGLMMDSGGDVLHTVLCFEDNALPHTIFCLDLC